MYVKTITLLVLTAFYSVMPSRISRHNNVHCRNEPTRVAVTCTSMGIRVSAHAHLSNTDTSFL
jgi:hypothetical protein